MARVLVTGATDGLGRALAAALARRDDRVLVHGRDRARAERVAEEIGAAGVHLADFASLAQVRRLAEEVGAVDVLVNNAGLVSRTRQVTEDGNELTFQVNHLAGFVLGRNVPAARVVNVASIGQHPLDFDDLMLERDYDAYRAYAQSKLAQIMFAFELAERRPDVWVAALHPATLMDTKMVRETFGRTASTVDEGVEAVIHAIDMGGASGRYFDGTREGRADPQAYDPAARRRLWEVSERLTAA
jgi:NAD(P)-dependent dehydrogenase (short-subunit alcohol dehydrogenase family)